MIQRFVDVLLALIIFGLLFGMFLSAFIETTIESIKARVNRLKIDCSDVPEMGSIEINFNGETVYCIVQET